MTWSDELRGYLEVIDARITAIESMPSWGYEHNLDRFIRMPTELPPPAVLSVGKNDHPVNRPAQALN